MGTKYPTQATSGYNSGPPADDGTVAASNLVTWSGVKTKLTDVLKTFGEAINTALVTAFDYSVRQVVASDSTVAGDHMRTVEIAPTVSAAVTVSLMDAATATANYKVWIKNSSTISQTVGRVTGGDTIDGVAGNVVLPSKSAALFQANASANGYLVSGWRGPDIDTNPLVVGGTDGTKKVRFEVDGLTTGTTRVVTIPDRDLTIGPVLATEIDWTQASTSGTSIDFTGIPAGVKRITVMLVGTSTNGTSSIVIRLGDSGGIETTGYVTASTGFAAATLLSTSYTNGFHLFDVNAASNLWHGSITFTLEDASDFTWVGSGVFSSPDTPGTVTVAGSKATSAALDRVSVTTTNGSDTFDAGVINISYE